MGNKSDCFEILRVFSQRDGITSFPLFTALNLKKQHFVPVQTRDIPYFAQTRFVVILYKIKIISLI